MHRHWICKQEFRTVMFRFLAGRDRSLFGILQIKDVYQKVVPSPTGLKKGERGKEESINARLFP